MELSGKIVVYLDLQCFADDFFDAFSREAHKIPGNATDKLHGVDLHEGDWETAGSVKLWSYTIDGRKEVYKEKIHIDEENRTITLVGVGGHVMEQFKKYNCIFAFSPKLLTFTLEYEKLKAEVPRPNDYLDFTITFLRDIDAHLAKA